MTILYSKEKGFLNAEHRYKGLTIVSLLPFVLKTMFILAIILATGIDSFTWYITIPMWISLLVSGIGFSSDNKKWNMAAWISTLLLAFTSIFIGYYEYFKWASTKLCFGLLIFFTIIFIIKRFLDNKNTTTKEI
ncbi:hypothetical protein [Turicibacter sanguinis]|uniref:hypothetical protein n=1 Tax=Turicibacter sanguinis TaxID=154288 RepID=UPI0021D48EC8|nr:hypothetical protein [Turicibacter sanguinis]MCU7198056.1 hypothetical protein [Turicibacter sanguinis]